MTWTLITMPAAEELAYGFTPAPTSEPAPKREGEAPRGQHSLRRFFVTLFVLLGLTTGVQSAFAETEKPGQRRIAEVNVTERKAECRNCPVQFQRKENP